MRRKRRNHVPSNDRNVLIVYSNVQSNSIVYNCKVYWQNDGIKVVRFILRLLGRFDDNVMHSGYKNY